MAKAYSSGCEHSRSSFNRGTRSGDIIECHGIKQRATYEYGAYALEKV